jgi:hypothetical protein
MFAKQLFAQVDLLITGPSWGAETFAVATGNDYYTESSIGEFILGTPGNEHDQ